MCAQTFSKVSVPVNLLCRVNIEGTFENVCTLRRLAVWVLLVSFYLDFFFLTFENVCPLRRLAVCVTDAYLICSTRGCDSSLWALHRLPKSICKHVSRKSLAGTKKQ